MKKQLPTHNDEPSIKPAPKVLKVEEPNYEGTVKQGKYEVDNSPVKHTDTQPKSKSGEPYPFPHDDIDLYAVDTRIWDRIGEMGGGSGDGGGPHTHDEYATKTELTDGLATKSDDPHTHSEYADKDSTNAILNGMAQDISSLETKTYNNQEAIKGKADTDHTHDDPDLTHDHDGDYQPVGDYATNDDLTSGLAGKADVVHIHDGRAYNGPVLEADYVGSYQAGLYPQAAGNFVMDTDPTGTFYLNHFVGGLYQPDTTRSINFQTNGGYALWGIKTSSGNHVNVLANAEHWRTWGDNKVGVFHSAGDHAEGQFEMAVGAIEQATADDLSAISAGWVSNATDAYHLIGTYDWFFLSNNIIFHAHMYSLGLGGSTRRARPTTFSQKAWDEYLAKQEPTDG